jgi:hypothetical protein
MPCIGPLQHIQQIGYHPCATNSFWSVPQNIKAIKKQELARPMQGFMFTEILYIISSPGTGRKRIFIQYFDMQVWKWIPSIECAFTPALLKIIPMRVIVWRSG